MNLLRYTLVLPQQEPFVVEAATIPHIGHQVEMPSGEVLPVLSVRHRLAETWQEGEARRNDGPGIVVTLGSPFRPHKPDFTE